MNSTNDRVILFLVEFGVIFGLTLLSMFLLRWRIQRYSGSDIFSNKKYLYVALGISVVVAFVRVILFNEEKKGRAFD